MWNQRNDAVNSEVEARVFLDARDNTEYGMLRTYARLDWIRSSGSDDNSGSQPRRAQFVNSMTLKYPFSTGGYQNLQTGFSAAEAFVQLGGFLAGRTTSFASVGLSALQFTTQNPSNGRVNQFAYTASLGNGMSLTAAVEDAAELREATAGTLVGAKWKTYATQADAVAGTNATTAYIGYTYGAIPNNIPDGVVSFDVAQSWGTAKIAGVLHNVAPAGDYTTANSKMGYAVMGSTKVNLPMIASGDNIQVFGAYAVGAAGRTVGNTMTDTNSTSGNYGFGIGRASMNVYDAFQDATSLTLSKSYSYGAQLQHYFAPTVSAYVGGTYGAIQNPGAWKNTGANKDGAVWGAAVGVIWAPATGLEINPEVAYRQARLSAVDSISDLAGYEGTSKKTDSAMYYRLRVARSF